MLSKNNHNLMAKRQPHYGLRKFSVGLVSVLLSTTIYLGINVTGAQADAIANSNTKPASAISVQTQSSQAIDNNRNVQAAPADSNSSVATTNSQQSSPVSKTDVPQVTTSLNDYVRENWLIKVVSHHVSTNQGDLEKPGNTNLALKLTIDKDEVAKIKSGNYIDIKLGLPYTAAGKHYVMSYGAVNDQQAPMVISYTYDGGNLIAGYIVPAGGPGLDTYQQESYGKESTVTNKNDQYGSLGTSNGYYRIIFNDGIQNYLNDHSGQASQWELSFNLNWYNGSKFQSNKEKKPSDFPIYTSGSDTSYTPDNDLQVGNYSMGSGLKFNVVHFDPSKDAVKLSKETTLINHTGNHPAHTWFKVDGKWYASVSEAEQNQVLASPSLLKMPISIN